MFQLDSQNPKTIESKLNQGMRIDYALQEAPLESFNEYLFALVNKFLLQNELKVTETIPFG